MEGNQEGKERKKLRNVIVEGKDRDYNFSAT